MERQNTSQQPFRNKEEDLISSTTSESNVFKFEDSKTHETWVRKEIRPSIYLSLSPEESASIRNKIFTVLKEYLGEYLPETHYIVSESVSDKPVVQIIQKYITGKTLKQTMEDNEWEPEYYDARKDIMEKAVKAMWDERIRNLPGAGRITESFSEPGNIMIDVNHKVWVIDW